MDIDRSEVTHEKQWFNLTDPVSQRKLQSVIGNNSPIKASVLPQL